MLKIGLTGGIGSGKTTISRILKVLGASVYAADERARELMNSNMDLIRSVTALFGDESYRNGVLNRAFIASIVFSDSSKLKALNALVHPLVFDDFLSWSDQQNSGHYVIHEAAILFETGLYKKFDYNILVCSPAELRIKRIMARDKQSEDDIRARMQQQWTDEQKMKLADFTIENNEKTMILPQVLNLHNKFVSLQAK